ncbi:hypothetical protein F5884DRAFT_899193 [Xylogone sp. PMI_703]|nr:hypothetical protein F5884DRAFT_899193 [Xylogone sp. PMI_703]
MRPPHPHQASGEELPRKRKAHKKSRGGCRNCKLRRIKCDEARPNCQRCKAFGVSCNYNSTTPDLHTGPDHVLEFDSPNSRTVTTDRVVQRPSYLTNQFRLPRSMPHYPFVIGDRNHIIELDIACMERFKRFLVRTVLTVGTLDGAHLFQRVVPGLAFANAYLMHIVQAITATHDRYLLPSSPSKQSLDESYHMTWGITLFSAKLSGPLQDSDRDPLWATAALLGAVVSASIEASAPEEAWPLKPSDPTDLEWLKMSESKSVIWKLTNPTRQNSAFHPASNQWTSYLYRLPEPPICGTEGLPEAFITLFDLDENSTADNNPYYLQAHAVAALSNIPCDRASIIRFLGLLTHLRPEYRSLMEQKDPRALLLICHWYALIIDGIWWIARRARVECKSICLYLEKRCKNDKAIMELLEYPRQRCGLVL